MNMLQLIERPSHLPLYQNIDILVNIKGEVLGVALEMFDEKHSPVTFTLTPSIPKIPTKLGNNVPQFLLLSEATRECKVGQDFFNEFEKLFWSEKCNKQCVECSEEQVA